MDHFGLILEGGGMRGLYTAGVLDFFLEEDMIFDYVIGVSAGACHAVSYISRQIERSKLVNTAFVDDWRYMSLKNLIKNGSLFGMDFIFDEIPNQIVPFDYQTFYGSPVIFKIGVTDCKTGKPLYFEKSDMDDKMSALRASSSLPLLSPIIQFRGYHLLDGGISDPIPVRKALSDGCNKVAVVLTRNRGYRKEPMGTPMRLLIEKKYRDYPGFIDAMLNRYKVYNETLDYLEQLEETGQATVIRPSEKLNVGRLEKNTEKLLALYDRGFNDAKAAFSPL